eukprot:scaffold42260_cov61-Phaeocystis_antarctica.AAC.2
MAGNRARSLEEPHGTARTHFLGRCSVAHPPVVAPSRRVNATPTGDGVEQSPAASGCRYCGRSLRRLVAAAVRLAGGSSAAAAASHGVARPLVVGASRVFLP